MFGTLVIQLPSNYTGGELAVYHQSKSKKFDFGGSMGCSNFHYVAFYADCQHEIKPVTKGYRLCLIYNLVYRGPGNCPVLADHREIVSAVISSMKEWGEDLVEENPPLMTYMLEHKYCDASLSFKLLKNSDRAVADVLSQAKKEVKFDFYVAKVSLVENWSASHDDCYYHHRFCHDSCDDYTADELCDETVTAENLISLEGHQSFCSIEIDKEHFVPENFFDSRSPDEEDFAEATGNEGATVDKQYNWAALLIWPLRNRIRNLGPTNMVRLLKSELQDQPISQERAAELEVVARDLIKCSSPDSSVSLLQSLQRLGKVELVVEFLDHVASSLYRSVIGKPSFSKEIAATGLKYGWDVLRSPLQAIFDKLSSQQVGDYVRFLHTISQQLSSEVQKDVCGGLASVVVTKLSNEEHSRPDTSSYYHFSLLGKSSRTEYLSLLFECLVTLQCKKQLPTLTEALKARPKLYSVLDTLVPVCDSLYKSLKASKSFEQLLSYCIASLKDSSSRIIPSPENWSQSVTFSCSCNDCQELMCFLKHPTKTQHRFKMGKGRRSHLHRQLDSKGCSVTHITEHVGNPHTLVVTKTRASYDKECKVVQKAKATLSRLLAMKATVPSIVVEESGPLVK